MSQLKQLKKNDFLAAVTEAPMTREQLVETLEEYEFLGSWLDYLTEHFTAQGKITKNEDGTIQRKGKKGGSTGPRMAYRVALVEDDEPNDEGEIESRYHIHEVELAAGDALNKEDGWATTKTKAVKNACTAAFNQYKASCADIKALLAETEKSEESE